MGRHSSEASVEALQKRRWYEMINFILLATIAFFSPGAGAWVYEEGARESSNVEIRNDAHKISDYQLAKNMGADKLGEKCSELEMKRSRRASGEGLKADAKEELKAAAKEEEEWQMYNGVAGQRLMSTSAALSDLLESKTKEKVDLRYCQWKFPEDSEWPLSESVSHLCKCSLRERDCQDAKAWLRRMKSRCDKIREVHRNSKGGLKPAHHP